MKRFLLNCLTTLCLATVGITFAGCQHDDPEPGEIVIIDEFSGPYCKFILGQETEGLDLHDIRLLIQAEDGSEFERTATHERKGSYSEFRLSAGIKEGTYRLLALTATESEADDDTQVEFGLGSRIKVTEEGIEVIDIFNPRLGLAGAGSKEDPFIISSPSHLFNLMMAVNDYDTNSFFTYDTYFSQVRNLDMKSVSRNCDLEYGWIPIGADCNTPFRGVYLGNSHTISNLMINRPNSAGIGLFGYVIDAVFDGVAMKDCSLKGQFAVGSLAGAVITSGNNNRGSASFTDCKVLDSTLDCPATSASVGGIVGAVDMHARTLLSDCLTQSTSISAGMNAGGILGGAGLYSSVMATNVVNDGGAVSTLYSGAGGIVGTTDTLQVVVAKNSADIRGATSGDPAQPHVGSGGIAGGAGFSWFSACENNGPVSGKEGVGGIVGSTRVKGSATESFVYNQAYLRHCSNSAQVKGSAMVGGLIGEAQAGAESVCNTAPVNGSEYVGGICGNSSIGAIQNAVNSGSVLGKAYVGGILGKTTWGSLINNQNIGTVSATGGIAGGVLALGGNNTMIHYCSNFGTVISDGSFSTGGIVGEVGDPREWTATNIVECIVGSMEIVMGFAGPVLAVVEETIELAHGVEITIKLIEKSIETVLQAADYTLFTYGLAEMISPEKEEELNAEMQALAHTSYQKIDSEIATLRGNISPTVTLFPSNDMSRHIDNITALTTACADEEVNDNLQEKINEAREERAEKLEKVAKAQEIVHTVIAGVAIAAGTVAFIGGEIATGGAATALLVVGTAASIVGGANALIKTCSEFENNAVVISQCVNAAPISAPANSNVSSIAGRICDGVLIHDCLSTAATCEGPAGLFAGNFGLHTEVSRCISVVTHNAPIFGTPCVNCLLVLSPDVEEAFYPDGNISLISPSLLSDPSKYLPLGFEIGEGKTWIITESIPFPIPEKSVYLQN